MGLVRQRAAFQREAYPRDDAQARGNVPLCIIARKRFVRKRSARYRTSSLPCADNAPYILIFTRPILDF